MGQYPYVQLNYRKIYEKNNYNGAPFYRALYFYGPNILTYNKVEDHIYKDIIMQLDPNNINQNLTLHNSFNSISAASFKILSDLSILVRDKSNNTIAFLTHFHPHTKKIKIVKECNGFNNVIKLKGKINSTTPLNASQETIAQLNKLETEKFTILSDLKETAHKYRKDYVCTEIEEYFMNLISNSLKNPKILNCKYYMNPGPDYKNNSIFNSCVKHKSFKSLWEQYKIYLMFPKYNLITTLDHQLFNEHYWTYTKYGYCLIFYINHESISLFTNFKWVYSSILEYNKHFRKDNREELEAIENEIKSGDKYVNMSLPKYSFLFKDIPEMKSFIDYYYSNLDNIKNEVNRIYKSVFDSPNFENLDSKLIEYINIDKEIKKIKNIYKFGTYEKKIVKSINEYDNIEDLVTHANYYIGKGLDLQCAKIDNFITY